MTGKRRRKPTGRAGKHAHKHGPQGRAQSPPRAKTPQAKPRPPAKPISTRRLWLFRFIAVVVIPAVLLGTTELTLRLIDYGFAPEALVEFEIDGQAYAGQNSLFSWRFFPPHLAREPAPYAFPVKKTENTCRIFVLGASAAMGVPEPTFSFGRMLEVMLSDLYPTVDFEVITTAMAAINSHAVLPIARDCARYEPDLFVVYLGNNEVTGPYGAGSVFAPLSGNLSVIRTAIALKGTRLGQLMANVLGSIRRGEGVPKMWRGLEMFRNNQVRADDPGLQTVYKHFRSNLQDIVEVGRQSGAAVVLCTVGCNLKDNPPFGSLHRPDLTEAQLKQWDQIYQQGIVHEEAGRYDEAIREYLRAAEIDDAYADLPFRLGRCHWLMGQYEEAKKRYIQARLQDTLRFAAETRTNEIIREVATESKDRVYLADTVEMLRQNSPHGIAGDELFYEHVHFNFTGNYLLAKLVLDCVEEAQPERFKDQRADKTEPLSEQQCAQHLAYTDWNRYKIAHKVLNDFIKRPPFSDRLYYAEQVKEMESDLAVLKTGITQQTVEQTAEEHRWALEQNPDDWVLHWKYGQFLVETFRDHRAATEQFREVQRRLPHAWLPYDSLGGSLLALGDLAGAIEQYETVIRLQPTSGRAYFSLGEASRRKGDRDKATEHYRRAVRWEPDCVPAYNHLARIAADEGDLNKAIGICQHGLSFTPNSAVLRGSLGTLLARAGKRDEAIKEFRAALEIDPNSAPIRRSLEILLKTYR